MHLKFLDLWVVKLIELHVIAGFGILIVIESHDKLKEILSNKLTKLTGR